DRDGNRRGGPHTLRPGKPSGGISQPRLGLVPERHHSREIVPMAVNIPGDEGGFASLGLEAGLIDVLVALGYEEPTEIQRESIPPLLEGRDLLGQAATGTGKTAAFALPLIQRMAKRGPRQAGPSPLILVPTRELAM